MKKIFDTENILVYALLTFIVLLVFHSYLLFHISVEIFSTLIAFSIFVFGWNTRRNFENGYLLIIAVAYLFIGYFDMFHALTYQGMAIFDYSPNFAIELWIVARGIEAVTFVVAYFYINRPVPAIRVLLIYLAVSLFMTGLIYADLFPDCFVPGQGLTAFKVTAEYVISAVLLLSLWLLRRSAGMPDRIKNTLSLAILITVAAELSFTLYHDMFGIFNIIGHVLKVISFYLLYESILSVGLTQPMDILTAKLRATQESNQLQQKIMIQQSRTAAMGEMVNAIAHHWRQPLNTLGIQLQSLPELARAGNLNDSSLDRMVSVMMDRILEMSHSIDSLRGLTANEDHEMQCCVLEEVKQAYRVLKSEFTMKNIELRMTCFGMESNDPDMCFCPDDQKERVRIIPSEFRQVVFNLLTNARDAVLLRRENRVPGLKGLISLRLSFEDGEEVLEIEDNGGGIPPEAMERVFDPFFTTKERGKGAGIITGTGIGLYIAKMVVEEHMRGRISAINGSEGARIVIRLPLETAS